MYVNPSVIRKTENSTAYHGEPKNNTIAEERYPMYYFVDPHGMLNFFCVLTLTVLPWDFLGPGTYAFGYEINNNKSGNFQFRNETKYANDTIQGSFGYLRPDGLITITYYFSDAQGFQSQTEIYLPMNLEKPWSTVPRRPLKWLTKKPNVTVSESENTPVTESFNLTLATIPPQLVKAALEEHNIDLTPGAGPSEILHPAVLKMANGDVEKMKITPNHTEDVGFESVKNFFPNDFPIVPFAVPDNDKKGIGLKNGTSNRSHITFWK